MKEYWVIVKKMRINGKDLSIILLDNADEILEYDTFDEAKEVSDLFEHNSDSGWNYSPRQVGKI